MAKKNVKEEKTESKAEKKAESPCSKLPNPKLQKACEAKRGMK